MLAANPLAWSWLAQGYAGQITDQITVSIGGTSSLAATVTDTLATTKEAT